MKQIKLVMLVGALILSAAGGFASYQMRSVNYYIMPSTTEWESAYVVSNTAPSILCNPINNGAYLCTVRAPFGYSTGQTIPAYEAQIIATYNN